jgi:hypothetical protein
MTNRSCLLQLYFQRAKIGTRDIHAQLLRIQANGDTLSTHSSTTETNLTPSISQLLDHRVVALRESKDASTTQIDRGASATISALVTR